MENPEERTAEIKKWCLNLIEDFRKEYPFLTEVQKKNLFPYLGYKKPCQIEIFWISEPIEYQLFVLLHDPEREDKEIVINGPYKGSDFFESLYGLMENLNWKRKVPFKPNSQFGVYADLDFSGDVGDQEGKYSDYLLPHLAEFVFLIEYDPFSKMKPGPSGSRIINDDGWCMIIKGNLLDCSKDEYNRFNPICSVKNSRFPEEIPESVKATPVIKKKERKFNEMFGAYFFPPVRIGDNVELSFKEKFINMVGNPIIEPEIENEFILGDLRGFFDRYGFIGFQTDNESEAIQALNVIFGVSNLFKERTIFPVREQDLISFTKDPENNNLGGFGYRITQIKNQNPFSPRGERKIKFSFSEMNTILRISQSILENPSLKNAIYYSLENSAHLKNDEYPQSFIFSWLIVENYISELFDALLSSKEINRERRKKFDNQDKWSMDSKIEILAMMDCISKSEYEFLSKYNKKRNRFIHSGETISEDEANEAESFSLEIIKRKIEKLGIN